MPNNKQVVPGKKSYFSWLNEIVSKSRLALSSILNSLTDNETHAKLVLVLPVIHKSTQSQSEG